MSAFDEFLASFPMKTERRFTTEELQSLAGRVPESVIELLGRVGLASSKQFFFTLAPTEGRPFLEAWGVNAELWEPLEGAETLVWDMVHAHNEFDTRQLRARGGGRGKVFAMNPPVKLGGHFGNAFGKESKATFAPEERTKHIAAQASLYGHRVKGLPKALMLPTGSKRRLEPKASRVARSPFTDPALHYAVVSALFDAKGLEAVLKVRSLKKLVVPQSFASPVLEKLVAQKVTVARAR